MLAEFFKLSFIYNEFPDSQLIFHLHEFLAFLLGTRLNFFFFFPFSLQKRPPSLQNLKAVEIRAAIENVWAFKSDTV